LAGDHTGWPRPEAVTLKDRTIEHQPTQIAGNKPIALGHGFSTLAWIPEAQGSWALPLRHERITSFETPISRAAFQLKQVCKDLQVRPIAAYDSEYGNASFVKQTAGIEADFLLRLREHVLMGAPPPYSGKATKVHGHKFKLADPSTWRARCHLEVEDPKWEDSDSTLAAVTLPSGCCSSNANPPDCRFWQANYQKFPKPMWLGWLGNASLEQTWRCYLKVCR